MIDYRDTPTRQAIQLAIKNEINAKAVERRKPRFSTRLSPSSLGEECAAETWFRYRWVALPEPSEPHMVRYNERGEKNEQDYTNWLRETGWTVRDIDPETNEQIAISAFNGHMYGKCDGIASHPVHTAGQELLLEYKYVNYKRFANLCNKSLMVEDPKYYGQVTLYMGFLNLPACLFLPASRNDEDFNIRIISFDPNQFNLLMAKAETVLTTKVRPARIAESPAFFKCKFCDFKDNCHRGKPAVKNCRSCVHATAVEDGKFKCEKWNAIIPNKEAMLAGCGAWESII